MNDHVPTHQSQTEDSGPGDDGSIDAAALAFAKRANPQPVEDAKIVEPTDEPVEEAREEEAEDEPEAEKASEEADSEEEPSDGEPDADTEDDAELIEVELGDKTFKVAPEVQKAMLRQADYSRKMNEVGAKEKVLAQQLEVVETLHAGAEKYAKAMAQVNAIDAQVQQYEALDWQRLEEEDPSRYSVLAVKFIQLQKARDNAANAVTAIGEEINESRQKIVNEKRDEMDKALKKAIPGWGEKLGTAITRYAIESGYTEQELRALTDPKVVVALDKARKFDALQKGAKDVIATKVKDAPPVLKPGAPRKTDPKSDAMARLRKSNSLDDAASAFAARTR
jgi:hypothetical protein